MRKRGEQTSPAAPHPSIQVAIHQLYHEIASVLDISQLVRTRWLVFEVRDAFAGHLKNSNEKAASCNRLRQVAPFAPLPTLSSLRIPAFWCSATMSRSSTRGLMLAVRITLAEPTFPTVSRRGNFIIRL